MSDAGFISSHQQDGPPFEIKSERYTPGSIRSIKTQFLHVGVDGALQGVHPRSPKIRAEFLQKLGVSKQLILNLRGKVLKVLFKLKIKKNRP